MARWTLARLLIVLAVGTTSLNSTCEPFQSGPADRNELRVHLSVDKSAFPVGGPVRVIVELQNTGPDPLLIGNTMHRASGFSSYIKFAVSDSRGNLSPATAMIADTFSMPNRPNPLSAVVGAWLLLLPHYSLMHEFNLDSEEFSFLAKPGRYRIWASYSSIGLNDPSTYRLLGLSSEELESLKYKSWTGKVRSNEVSIIITELKN